MKTTLKEIHQHRPCTDGFEQLIYSITGRKESPEMDIDEQFSLLTEEEKDKEVDLIEILESNGIKDAVWVLRCFDYRFYCLFLADVAESVLPIFEAKYPEDDRPMKAIQAIRDFHAGKISAEELAAEAAAARAAVRDAATGDAAWAAALAAAWAAAAEDAAWDAAWAAAWDAAWAAEDAAWGAAWAAARAAAEDTKRQEIEELFRKHFVKD